MIADFRNCRVTVMGLGAFGGGIGAIRFLAERGAAVTVTDAKTAEELAKPLAQIAGYRLAATNLGGHRESDFTDADLIVASPAVPKGNRYLQMSRDAGIPITSEMNLFWERNRGRTICVTGSNGKSTTTAMIHAILAGPQKTEGKTTFCHHGDQLPAPATSVHGTRVWLGGNIGVSLLPVVDEITAGDWVVLELSSFQLENLAELQPNPYVAIVTNFSPNHLDHHETLEAYRQAKQNLLRWQTEDRIAVLNDDDSEVRNWPTRARRFWFGRNDTGQPGLFGLPQIAERPAYFRDNSGEQSLPIGNWLRLPGSHNYQNALAASCAALALGCTPLDLETGLKSFAGLPHRLELVAEAKSRRFINDSKATTPEATILALESFREPVVLLVGGYDKGIDLRAIIEAAVRQKVRAIACLGQTGPALLQQIQALDPLKKIAAGVHHSFTAAFDWCLTQTQPGDVVLLSPGCASYDWFTNYEARGEAFKQLVQTVVDAERTSDCPSN